MKRKQMYIGVAILLIACVIGVCAYRIAMDRQSGFQNRKIFHFLKLSKKSIRCHLAPSSCGSFLP